MKQDMNYELLIAEREAYEMDFIPDFALEPDELDHTIEWYGFPDEDSFDEQEYIEPYDDYYEDYMDIDSYVEVDVIMGYVPNTDPFDSLDGGYGCFDEPYAYYD